MSNDDVFTSSVITGYHEVYDEQGNLISSDPLYKDVSIAKSVQIRYIYETVTEYADSKISKMEREQILALSARIHLNLSLDIFVKQSVIDHVNNWLSFCEDLSIYAYDLVMNVVNASDYDTIVAQVPDFSSFVPPQKQHVAVMLKTLRGI